MIRRIISVCGWSLAVALSLAALAVPVLWVWSFYERCDLPGFDTLHYPREPRGGEIFIRPRVDRGRFQLRYCRVVPGGPPQYASLGPRWGFAYLHTTDGRYPAGTFVEKNYYFPAWVLLPPMLLFPLIFFVRWRRRHRRLRRGRENRCLDCGYSLVGNVSGVCPECGLRCRQAMSGSERPVIVWRTACTLCSAPIDVPPGARDWARCPSCGALVPI